VNGVAGSAGMATTRLPGDAAGYRLVVAAVLLFSFNPVIYRRLALDPLTILFGVNVVAVITLAAVTLLQGRRAALTAWSGAGWPLFSLATCFAINNVLFLTAIQKTTVANATMTHYLAPLFVAALAAPVIGEPVRRRALLAMSTAGIGVAVMLAASGLSLADRHFVGLLYGTASALFFALEIVLKKRLAPLAPVEVIATRYLAVSLLLLAPFADYAALRDAAPADHLTVVIAGTLTSALGIYLFGRGLQTASAQAAAVISYLEPLGAIAWALLLIGEVPDAYGITGGLLVVAGILIVIGMREPGPAEPLARPGPR
jgi:drug/metabolite transporter (DMT)-like permease